MELDVEMKHMPNSFTWLAMYSYFLRVPLVTPAQSLGPFVATLE